MEEKQCEKIPVGDFGDYITPFLKSDNVKDEKQAFSVMDAEQVLYDNVKKIRLHLFAGEEKYVLDLNKTNTIFLYNTDIKNPADIVGKRIYFKKVMAFSPAHKKEVESLRILKVEGITGEEKVVG